MFFRRILSTSLALLALTAITYAQQQQTPAEENQVSGQKGPREGRRQGRMGRHRGFAALHKLNLSEEQRQQQRAILQRQLGTTKAQREELFKLREKRFAGTLTAEDQARVQALRRELRDSMQSTRTEMETVLTAEQRAKLEELKTQRKVRRDEMREHRRDRREHREPMPR
ncbi:MAG TPA: Spy/CpxP family protein refolding chaperone [Pyrinomonadaceae bacterium]|nr:Spy/CpxP family protein refolding chaperone [Pyrinomonadaceae bacterium]